jgi:DNA-binding transcriptional LysR family regulator
MQLAAFEAFVKVMETGSISAASEKLFVTQPAISKRIQSVENHFGVRLFEAVGRRVQATPAAEQIYPRIKHWLQDLADIQRALSHTQNQVQGRLKIGTSHHIGLHHLPDYLKAYTQTYPDVEFDIQFVDSEQAHHLLLAGEIEVAFLTLPPSLDRRLHYAVLWQDALCFVCAPFHPLAQRDSPALTDLVGYPCLLPSAHTYTTQITLAEFARHGLKPQVSMTTNALESIRMLVSIGLGWSVLPQTLLNDDLVVLDMNLHLQRQLGMVWHPQRSQSTALHALIQQFNSSIATRASVKQPD